MQYTDWKFPGLSYVCKSLSANLSNYSVVSVSVYAARPTPGDGLIQVGFQIEGSNHTRYLSPYQSIHYNSRSVVQWNMSEVPRVQAEPACVQ